MDTRKAGMVVCLVSINSIFLHPSPMRAYTKRVFTSTVSIDSLRLV